MAYKPSYKIPNSLDKSFLDQEITLSKKGIVKAIPLKVIIFYLVSVIGLFWVVGSTFVKEADFIWVFLLVLWWILATVFFGRCSKTKELKAKGLPTLINYLSKSNRKLITRSASNASGFYSITGIKAVDSEGGIRFADGTLGQAYLVVGSASILVFEADKQAIINRVDSFYRKIETGTEYIWVTTKEPQRVYRQLASLERKNLALQMRDPELFALLDEQANILTDYVGSRFNSIHQYLVIKSGNDETLRRAHALLQSEIQDSSLMIKNCTILDGKGFLEMARGVYAEVA
ncbi:MAG: hypothetical protein B5766_05245 [Candidatus Lumbricidophila eiseniae]|uniref:Uncharacterized protein n=1 Tax=Candidatus Lumbricidiphila eiseniae TaxID=1969409 RepID=A0A2A6FRF8_9MICO|nr:MAG: hypothetical protein B5766_05245 [Candidatus Lumbricidophila eiseniae]